MIQSRDIATVAMWVGYGLSIALAARSLWFIVFVAVLGFWATLRTLGTV